LKITFACIAYEGVICNRIHTYTTDRAGIRTDPALITGVFVQNNPFIPLERAGGTRFNAVMILACKTNMYVWRFRPITIYPNAGSLGCVFPDMAERADLHADLALGSLCMPNDKHMGPPVDPTILES
jgi:hypothetical protein